MLNDEFHAARDVTKTSSTRMDTFPTRELGVLGWIDGPVMKVGRAPARVALRRADAWLTPFDLSSRAATALPRVEIAYNYQQAGGEAITAFADAGVKGIVTAGTGAGGVASARAARAPRRRRGSRLRQHLPHGLGLGVRRHHRQRHRGRRPAAPEGATDADAQPGLAEGDVAQVRQWVTTIGNPEWDTAGQLGGHAARPAQARRVIG